MCIIQLNHVRHTCTSPFSRGVKKENRILNRFMQESQFILPRFRIENRTFQQCSAGPGHIPHATVHTPHATAHKQLSYCSSSLVSQQWKLPNVMTWNIAWWWITSRLAKTRTAHHNPFRTNMRFLSGGAPPRWPAHLSSLLPLLGAEHAMVRSAPPPCCLAKTFSLNRPLERSSKRPCPWGALQSCRFNVSCPRWPWTSLGR